MDLNYITYIALQFSYLRYRDDVKYWVKIEDSEHCDTVWMKATQKQVLQIKEILTKEV